MRNLGETTAKPREPLGTTETTETTGKPQKNLGKTSAKPRQNLGAWMMAIPNKILSCLLSVRARAFICVLIYHMTFHG